MGWTAGFYFNGTKTTPEMDVSWTLMKILQTKNFVFFENKYFFDNQNQKIHENREIPWFFIGFDQKPLIFRDFQIFLGFDW